MLTDSDELTKVRNKLYCFLEKNPEVDHYLCDNVNTKVTFGLLLGLILGILLGMVLFALVIYLTLNGWHAAGWLHIPGSQLWG